MSWVIDVFKGVRGKSTEKVSKEERQVRLDQCNSCTYLMQTGQCNKCGCFVVDKTKYTDERCPAKKW